MVEVMVNLVVDEVASTCLIASRSSDVQPCMGTR